MFLLQMVIRVILSSVQQYAFVTWKEAVVVVFSLVSIEIVLSSKTLLAYSTGKGINMAANERFVCEADEEIIMALANV
jgi:hypothetical protein